MSAGLPRGSAAACLTTTPCGACIQMKKIAEDMRKPTKAEMEIL